MHDGEQWITYTTSGPKWNLDMVVHCTVHTCRFSWTENTKCTHNFSIQIYFKLLLKSNKKHKLITRKNNKKQKELHTIIGCI